MIYDWHILNIHTQGLDNFPILVLLCNAIYRTHIAGYYAYNTV